METNNETNNKLEKIQSNQIVSSLKISLEKLNNYLNVMGLAKSLTANETKYFLEIAQAFNLNPFKREIYCTKYGDQTSIVIGYEVYIKKGEETGQLNGWGAVTSGSVKDDDLKATVTIYRKDWNHPFVHEVIYSEYVQRKRDGTINKFWREKPITMIKKVGIAQAFRMCFEKETSGMPYAAEEIIESEIQYAKVINQQDSIEAICKINECTTLEELQNIWKEFKPLQKDPIFIKAKNNKKIELGVTNVEIIDDKKEKLRLMNFIDKSTNKDELIKGITIDELMKYDLIEYQENKISQLNDKAKPAPVNTQIKPELP